jgi:hypothetical protein
MVAFLWLPYAAYGCIVLPMVTSVALCYLLLHIGQDHTLCIYHVLVSLAGQIIHPSIHSFHEAFFHSYLQTHPESQHLLCL